MPPVLRMRPKHETLLTMVCSGEEGFSDAAICLDLDAKPTGPYSASG